MPTWRQSVSLQRIEWQAVSTWSGRAAGLSQVQLNVGHASPQAPDRVTLEVRKTEGALETLTDGRLNVAFQVGQGASRVSAEFWYVPEPRWIVAKLGRCATGWKPAPPAAGEDARRARSGAPLPSPRARDGAAPHPGGALREAVGA